MKIQCYLLLILLIGVSFDGDAADLEFDDELKASIIERVSDLLEEKSIFPARREKEAVLWGRVDR